MVIEPDNSCSSPMLMTPGPGGLLTPWPYSTG
jgi:hypothetical protein